MTIEALNQRVGGERGKGGGWPKNLTYEATDGPAVVTVKISNPGTTKEDVFKRIDPWGLAFFDEVKQCTGKPMQLIFDIKVPSTPKAQLQYEALKRRVSYLASANNLHVTLLRNKLADALYSMDDLAKRPDREKIRDVINQHGDNDKPGRLEKDFQAYLYGKGLFNSPDTVIRRTNARLALFGDDFVRIGKFKTGNHCKGYKVEREFPTGAFCDEIKEHARILPTEFIDLVTINRDGDVAVIELKFDDPKLEVIPQVLNYSLFFHSYRSQLTGLLDKHLECSTRDANLVTYLVSNTFHPRFASVWHYYSRGPLKMKQVIMGYMPDQG